MLVRHLCWSFALTLLLVGCDSQSETPNEAVNQPEIPVSTEASPAVEQNISTVPADAPTYKIYIDSSYPPFAYKDEFGNPAGFDIEILSAIGELRGFHINFIGVPWEGIFANLDNGKADIVGSGVSITDERQESMSFTDPYIDSSVVIAYNSPDTKRFEDLASAKFGVQSGSSYITQLVNQHNIAPSQIKEYPTSFLALQNLLSSQVDGVVEDKSILDYHLQSLKGKADISNVKMVEMPGSENHPMAFAITKDRTDLVNEINEGLETIRFNGTYDEIYSKWFGHRETSE